ncbi:unnamed protein product [Amoebophrya sp. A25]|nr:unnamed protein product [Amoebophrya sp. A25]|eukprot:GSA25T00001977001.1
MRSSLARMYNGKWPTEPQIDGKQNLLGEDHKELHTRPRRGQDDVRGSNRSAGYSNSGTFGIGATNTGATTAVNSAGKTNLVEDAREATLSDSNDEMFYRRFLSDNAARAQATSDA